MAMHACDLMICIGARNIDGLTGQIDRLPRSFKTIQIDIDRSSITQSGHADIAFCGDAAEVLEDLARAWRTLRGDSNRNRLEDWWSQIEQWRIRPAFSREAGNRDITPEYALERLDALTKHASPFIIGDIDQHQTWAAQFFSLNKPRHWIVACGLGTRGFGLPAAIGAQLANPGELIINLADVASIQTAIKELSAAIQHEAKIKIFVINNGQMGLDGRFEEVVRSAWNPQSYSASLPDFAKLAEAYGAVGLRCQNSYDLDDKIKEMISLDRLVLLDCRISQRENQGSGD